jgi:hypothetical protein
MQRIPPHISLIVVLFVVLVAAFDYWQKQAIQRAIIRGGLVVLLSQLLMVPLGRTALWHSFANGALEIWRRCGF